MICNDIRVLIVDSYCSTPVLLFGFVFVVFCLMKEQPDVILMEGAPDIAEKLKPEKLGKNKNY